MLTTAAGSRYKGLIIPNAQNLMSDEVCEHINLLRQQGAHIIYGTDAKELAQVAHPEEMKTRHGLKMIRRKNPTGYHYFIANLTPNDIDTTVQLAVPSKGATWFNPLNGDITPACLTDKGVALCLRSGESRILQVYQEGQGVQGDQTASLSPLNAEFAPWSLSFIEEEPKVDNTFQLDSLQTWETLDEQTRVTMGTGVYTTTFHIPHSTFHTPHSTLHTPHSTFHTPHSTLHIDLGDVRESARVYINGEFIGCAWSVPYVLDTRNTIKDGKNELRIEVTNLPANRISELDRKGVKWRKMEEINVVDINYKKTTYADWEPVPSGLNGPIRFYAK